MIGKEGIDGSHHMRLKNSKSKPESTESAAFRIDIGLRRRTRTTPDPSTASTGVVTVAEALTATTVSSASRASIAAKASEATSASAARLLIGHTLCLMIAC